MNIKTSFMSLTIAVFAVGLLSGCKEENKQSAIPAQQTQQTSSNTSDNNDNWIWPGEPEGELNVVDDVLVNNYMVVYDGSGSMGDADSSCGVTNSKHSEGVSALNAFANAVPATANLGLYVFDSKGISLRVPLSSNNRAEFTDAVKSVSVGGGTPLRSAVYDGYKELTKQGQSQFGYGRYILVIVTDGAASSGQDPTKVVNEIVNYTPVEVHTVGFCLSENHSLNQPGRTFYSPANSPKELIDGLQAVLAESNENDVTEWSD